MLEQFLTFRSLLRILPVILLIILATVFFVGCTSDLPNDIGVGLVETEFEVELLPLEISNTTMYSAMTIVDANVPFDQQEVLYMGSQGGNTSSILTNFDFRDIYTEEFPDTLFTQGHIVSVNMRGMVLDYYQGLGTAEGKGSEDKGLSKDFLIYQLTAPFDSTAFPGPEPAHEPEILNIISDPDPGTSFKVVIPIYTTYFLQCLEEPGLVGFLMTEGNNTEEGLVGYASRDMKHGGSTLDPVYVDVPLGMIFQVTFDTGDVLVIESVADISTFHEESDIPETSDDGFVMRTVLRSYPALRFDYSTLPKNIFINRAILQVVNDTLSSFGRLDGVIAAEVDTVFFRDSNDEFPTWDVSELEDISTIFFGMGELGLDPVKDDVFQFNVTTSVQRIVNDAYEGSRGFILTGPEGYITYYPALNPDIYFVEYHFHGTNNPDPNLRPKLLINYTTIDEFQEGGAK